MDDENSLIAVQGPKAATLLSLVINVNKDYYNGQDLMTANFDAKYKSMPIIVSRCGYTG